MDALLDGNITVGKRIRATGILLRFWAGGFFYVGLVIFIAAVEILGDSSTDAHFPDSADRSPFFPKSKALLSYISGNSEPLHEFLVEENARKQAKKREEDERLKQVENIVVSGIDPVGMDGAAKRRMLIYVAITVILIVIIFLIFRP